MARKSDLEDCNYDPIIRSSGRYKYDFKFLEYKIQQSYELFLSAPTNTEYFRQFFEDLYLVALGILETSEVYSKKVINKIDVAHEYSVGLIERILEGKWRAHINQGEDRFGWVPYIRLNIRTSVYNRFIDRYQSSNISIDELREVVKEGYTDSEDKAVEHPALIDMETYYLMETETLDSQLAQKCYKYLELMFGDKYYTMVSKFLALGIDDINDIKEDELRLFVKTALVLFKRLYESYNLSKVDTARIDKVFNSSLYLASILSSDKDKRLYVSLDLANLYRLALSHGGETLQVPTIEELDELISTARVSYEILSADLGDLNNVKRIRDKVRDDYNIHVRSDKLSANVRNVFRYLSTEITDPEVQDNSLVDSLLSLSSRSDDIINKILDKLEVSIATLDSSSELIKVYKEMIENLNLSLNLMTNIKSLMESRFSKEV